MAVLLSAHCESTHTLLWKEQSITHQDHIIRSATAAGQQQQTQACLNFKVLRAQHALSTLHKETMLPQWKAGRKSICQSSQKQTPTSVN